LRVRGRAAAFRARRPGSDAPPAPLLLEEREVDPRAAASGRGRARLLGDERVPQLRRPVEGAALLGRLTGTVREQALALRVPLDVVGDERAQRDHVEVLTIGVLERRPDEFAAEARAFERLVHLSVRERDSAVAAAIRGQADEVSLQA